MCGISGIVDFSATSQIDRDLIERMTSAQNHRGPDDHGYFVDKNVGLGHRRLSIIDRRGGKQPIFNEDGSVVVISDGEIYNYADLTGDLIARGHRFTTQSDTETIVHAYEEKGEECMHDFRGMFAFAIWDRRKKRLLLVRDRLGVKRVYYYLGKQFIAFASEIKSLLHHPRVPKELDRDALDLYLALRYVPGPRTIFKHIYKLQPGHCMTVDEGGRTKIRKYWDIEYDSETVGPSLRQEDLIERFGQLFEESVRLQLISEAPVGVLLSGGLDSSAVLAMMAKTMKKTPLGTRERIKTFSVGYEATGSRDAEIEAANEFSFARHAARHFGADHHEFRMTARDFRNAIPTVVAHLDEPIADPTCIPLYFISKLARNYITVVLSGEGADETLAGYNLYGTVLALDRMRRAAGPFALAFPVLARLPLESRVRACLRRAGVRIEDHYRGVVKGISLETRRALTGVERVERASATLDGIFAVQFSRVERASPLNRMLYADLKIPLPENLLLKADKMTMATAVKLRVPFLDHKLVEYAATLPDDMKLIGSQGKRILRQVMRTELPPSILHRAKKGFPMPAETWFRFELRDFVRDTLLARNSACRRFFEPQAVGQLVSLQEQGKFSRPQEVWSLLVFEFWHRQFIEELQRAHAA